MQFSSMSHLFVVGGCAAMLACTFDATNTVSEAEGVVDADLVDKSDAPTLLDAPMGKDAPIPFEPIPIRPTGAITEGPRIGGAGGGLFDSFTCDESAVVVGISSTFYLGGDNGAGFCEFKALCGQIQTNSQGTTDIAPSAPVPPGHGIGMCNVGTPLPPLQCPSGQVVVGLSAIRSGLYAAITQVRLQCATITTSSTTILQSPTGAHGAIIGNPSNELNSNCENDQVLVGFSGTHGLVLDSLSILCRPLTQGF